MVPVPKAAKDHTVAWIDIITAWIKADFEDISCTTLPTATPRHDVTHEIKTMGLPVRATYRRLDPVRLEAAKAYFQEMVEAGICRRSDSPWASPLHMVMKPDGSYHPCGDFRQLNTWTVKSCYSLPNLHDFSAKLAGMKFFTMVDLTKAFWQVPVHRESIPKTAVITPFGTFEFLRMPFGLCNASCTFQRLIDQTLAGIPCVFAYIDDLLIYSPNLQDHDRDVCRVLSCLRQAGIQYNPAKTKFFQSEVKFLGHQLSGFGILPLVSNQHKIGNFPTPTNKVILRCFLGVFNYYRSFCPGMASILKLLTDMTSVLFNWSTTCNDAFLRAKSALDAVKCISFLQDDVPTRLSCDASDVGLGAVLEQQTDSVWCPLEYWSRKLTPTKQKYSTFDRELLSVFLAIRHFRWFLTARDFFVLTDHKPLVTALHRVGEPWSPRQAQHLYYVAEFTSSIIHVPGDSNAVADALSRDILGVCVEDLGKLVDLSALATAQSKCSSVNKLKKSSVLRLQTMKLSGCSPPSVG